MESFGITALFSFPSSLNLCVLFAVLCVPFLALFSHSKRQRILFNVPIIGVDGSRKAREAREQFRHGSKAMLLEGYQKVFIMYSA